MYQVLLCCTAVPLERCGWFSNSTESDAMMPYESIFYFFLAMIRCGAPLEVKHQRKMPGRSPGAVRWLVVGHLDSVQDFMDNLCYVAHAGRLLAWPRSSHSRSCRPPPPRPGRRRTCSCGSARPPRRTRPISPIRPLRRALNGPKTVVSGPGRRAGWLAHAADAPLGVALILSENAALLTGFFIRT
jgi:hypothetical protein